MKKRWKKAWGLTAGVLLLMIMTVAGQAREVEASSLFSLFTDGMETKTEDNIMARATAKNWRKVNGKCYNGVGKVIPGAITWGIDISEWQGDITWSKVKSSGIDFAFIRAGYGARSGSKYSYNQDQYYKNNISGAQLAGVPAGVYLYSKARTTAEAVKDAKYLISQVKGYKISYPLVLDLEDESVTNLSRSTITNIAKAFCQEIKRAGYYPMVYSNTYWYNTYYYPDQLAGYDFWLASYKDSMTGLGGQYRHTIWQATDGDNSYRDCYSTRGLISGIPVYNSVDIDFGYVDYTKIITPRYAPVASYDPDGGSSTPNGWVTEGNKKYYYDNGVMVTGWRKIDGKYYRFNSAGAMQTNRMFRYSNGKICYLGKDGVRKENGWLKYNNQYYYMKNGYALKGLRKISGKYYYFHVKYGYRCENRKLVLNGNIYYFGDDGVRFNNGWKKLKINGKTYTFYFVNKPSGGAYGDGYALRGWQTISGERFYFRQGTSNLSGIRAENVSITSKGVTYVFDSQGHYKTK